MSHLRGYTIAELTFTLIVIVLIGAIVVPMLEFGGRRRGHPRQMQSSTQVRGIIQGLINYSPGNKDRYPGLTADGKEDTTLLKFDATTYGTPSRSGYDPAYRIAILIRNSYFTPEYAISPSEIVQTKVPASLSGTTSPIAIPPGAITKDTFSFAMLRIDDEAGKGRRDEWSATTNSKAAVISDRNLGPMSGKWARSIHDVAGSQWRGTVGFNDNHVNFETDHRLTDTAYAAGGEVAADNLFADDLTKAGNAGFDAGMVHQDATTYLNQN